MRRRRYFILLDVPTQSDPSDSHLFGRFACGISFHSVSMLPIYQFICQEVFIKCAPLRCARAFGREEGGFFFPFPSAYPFSARGAASGRAGLTSIPFT